MERAEWDVRVGVVLPLGFFGVDEALSFEDIERTLSSDNGWFDDASMLKEEGCVVLRE